MLEILYRIYQVPDEQTKEQNRTSDIDFGLFYSTSKSENTELVMDCLICESREQFKELIKFAYGNNIGFRHSKNLKENDVYCVIIGEHAYNKERYFNKITFKCDCCGATIETYYGKPLYFSDYEVRSELCGIPEYSEKRFCSHKCKQVFLEQARKEVNPNGDSEFYVTRDMFSEQIGGYIYKITKKSTGEFYIGQTRYAPPFRWAQHLKTERFKIENILDYQFEVLEIVKLGVNIFDIEKQWIKNEYEKFPGLSLNIACVTQEMISRQTTL